jgi:hypothetical protein
VQGGPWTIPALREWRPAAGTYGWTADVIVEWWTNLDGLQPSDLLAAGHEIVNCGYVPTYYINGLPS